MRLIEIAAMPVKDRPRCFECGQEAFRWFKCPRCKKALGTCGGHKRSADQDRQHHIDHCK